MINFEANFRLVPKKITLYLKNTSFDISILFIEISLLEQDF